MRIRTFTPADRAALQALFRVAGQGAPTESLWGHAASEAEVYLDPYMDHAPDSLLLAEDGGALVGYLTGCADSTAFPGEAARMDEAIRRHRLITKPACARFFARSLADMAGAVLARRVTAGELDDARWPAHLHINVAPQVRGTGAAEALMRTWQQRLAESGSPGCHLQTLVENTRAVRFFRRMGFTEHGPTPLVPGMRHQGRRLHQQTMVWSP